MIRSKSVSLFEESVKLVRVRVMALNATFNNISVISWRFVFLVEGTGKTREKTPTRRKSLTNLSHYVVLNRVRTHIFSGDRH